MYYNMLCYHRSGGVEGKEILGESQELSSAQL